MSMNRKAQLAPMWIRAFGFLMQGPFESTCHVLVGSSNSTGKLGASGRSPQVRKAMAHMSVQTGPAGSVIDWRHGEALFPKGIHRPFTDRQEPFPLLLPAAACPSRGKNFAGAAFATTFASGCAEADALQAALSRQLGPPRKSWWGSSILVTSGHFGL